MLSKLCYFVIICLLFVWIIDFCGENSYIDENEKNSRALVRSKRYLVFPEGSSLQLVFCLQTSALIPIGDIFLYDNTLALAWTLPTDPKLLLMFKEYEKTAERRGDDKNIYYVKEGKILAKVPFKRPDIIKPVFTKRSVNKNMTFKEKLKIKIEREKMHERKVKEDYLRKDHLHHDDIEFHRNSRIGIYEKIVPLISALGGDGRQCVLYILCESARISRQGTFLKELARVIFTLTKGKEFGDESHREFDNAHRSHGDCALLYPGCDLSII